MAYERGALGKAIGAANVWHARAEGLARELGALKAERNVRRGLWFCVGALVSLMVCGGIQWLAL